MRTLVYSAGIALAVVSVPVWSASGDLISLRPQNPFMQVFGQPGFLSAQTLAPGVWQFSTKVSVASHADTGTNTNEQILLDGETLLLEGRAERGIGERWQVHVVVPYYDYSGGFLDAPVEQFHKLMGTSNDERDGPRGRMRVVHQGLSTQPVSVDGGDGGLGDIRFGAAYRLHRSAADVLTVHAGVKLPTGDADELTGSEATDVYAALAWQRADVLGRGDLTLDVHAGLLYLGDGEVLASLQEDTVYFAGVALTWQFADAMRLLTQVSGSSAYYDSSLAELDSPVVQLGLGMSYQPLDAGWSVSLAVVEDIWSDATTDFAVQLEFNVRLQGQR